VALAVARRITPLFPLPQPAHLSANPGQGMGGVMLYGQGRVPFRCHNQLREENDGHRKAGRLGQKLSTKAGQAQTQRNQTQAQPKTH